MSAFHMEIMSLHYIWIFYRIRFQYIQSIDLYFIHTKKKSYKVIFDQEMFIKTQSLNLDEK